MISINHLAFNMLKPTMKILTLKFSLFVVKVFVVWRTSCVICNDIAIFYHRLYIGQVTAGWTLTADVAGLGMLNAKELNQIIKDVDKNITNKHHFHELFKTIIEYQNPDLE